jgi:E3 ubiquitin-protein ligase TRIP12
MLRSLKAREGGRSVLGTLVKQQPQMVCVTRKQSGGHGANTWTVEDGAATSAQPQQSRRHKRASARQADIPPTGDDQNASTPVPPPSSYEQQLLMLQNARPSAAAEPADHDMHGEDDDQHDSNDLFRAGLLGRLGGPGGFAQLRAFSGMMSGASTAIRLRELLEQLKDKDDPSIQMIALSELSQFLLVSTEDNLSGQFSPDLLVRELVTLMQPSETGEENPEIMLLACRCVANLMEALPQAVASVVYGGAVSVLCQKLLEIHYIDVAEQALSVRSNCVPSQPHNGALAANMLARHWRRYLWIFLPPSFARAA